MGLYEDQMKAMRFEGPELIPVSVGILPAAWMRHRERLDEIVASHPALFGETVPGQRDYDAVGGTYVEGEHVDAWGCVWSNIHTGCEAIVTHHPVPTREAVRRLQPPAPGAGVPHGFMWLRLSDLRGFEELMVDFAEEPGELQLLIDLVRDYNLGEIRRILEGRPPGMIYFGDDLGMQTSLAIGAAKWRSYLKPCYAAFYSLCHGARQDVYMHTDGHLLPIVDDLIECGVDVLNPQIRANGLEGLVRTCKAKVCVDLDLDRQLMPFATPAEMDEHIRECTAALGAPEGGLWLKAEIGPDVPLANVKAIFAALERYRGMFA